MTPKGMDQMNLSPSQTDHSPASSAHFLRAPAELRSELAPHRAAGRSIGLVPTMGSLHEGHISLLRAARRECEIVVMSLFVNPSQFGPEEDLERYPRDEDHDARLASEAGVDLIYAPPLATVYPENFSTSVDVAGLTEVLDGDPASRGPQHFRGVTTIVAKLFNTVQPEVAYFGRKDAQQLAVIRRMVRDLDIPVRIEGLPTVREEDGLAMSSRNAYLNDEERERAVALSRALQAAVAAAQAESLAAGVEVARAELAAAGIEPEYLQACDPEDLTPVAAFDGRPVLLALAARVGEARLIDNVLIKPRTEA